MKFFSDEWYSEFKSQLLDIFSAGKTPTKITLKLCEKYAAVPQLGGQDAWINYVFENGVITSITRGEGSATAPDADFVSDADYATAVKVMTGEMSESRALMSGKVKLKGSIPKALKMLDTYSKIQATKHLGGKTEW